MVSTKSRTNPIETKRKDPATKGIKRLFFDCETAPNVGLFWSAGYKQKIDYDNIIKERAIICICYKWAGQKAVHSLSWDKRQDDKKMLREFIKIVNEADELIGHNGDKFDLAWIRTRCLFHKISMFPSYTTIDTLKAARSKFRFNSNRLDYIASYLGVGNKIKTTFGLWKDIVLHKDEKAMREMVKYCKGDVALLERVYDKMSQHIAPKTHHGVLRGEEKHSCPDCGSYKMKTHKTRVTAKGNKQKQKQCNDCGKYHTFK